MDEEMLKALIAKAQQRIAPEVTEQESAPQEEGKVEDDNPPFDTLTENIAYHWRRYESKAREVKEPARKPEASVLKALKTWLKKLEGIDVKRVSVGKMMMRTGAVINFGGVKGESDLILTPHKGQPFDRQIHVEVKRPDIIIEGKKVQRAGKQSDDQKQYQADMEARGDKYVVVTSVYELREYLVTLGFTNLPTVRKGK